MIVLMSGVATSIIGYPCPLAEAIHNSESVLSRALFLVLKLHLILYTIPTKNQMAAAQVAKKLKDRRQKQTLEEIFRKVLIF